MGLFDDILSLQSTDGSEDGAAMRTRKVRRVRRGPSTYRCRCAQCVAMRPVSEREREELARKERQCEQCGEVKPIAQFRERLGRRMKSCRKCVNAKISRTMQARVRLRKAGAELEGSEHDD